ncbi:kinase-like protein, partial [Neoconidiobolus thromboides FSU 785]
KEVEQISRMFSHLSQDYYIYDKIGEGTFSSVYKGVDIKFDLYDNSSWDLFDDADDEEEEFNFKKVPQPPPNLYKLVAIKKIYVTSSCSRIENEIELLSILSGHPNVVSLITALRHEDQIIAITPYYRHHDFRDTFLLFSFQDMQSYLRCLLRGLLRCHQLKIIHRDVKPSNFLYHMTKRRGQLADFGLAQRIENTNREERLDFDKLREEAPKSNDPNLHKNPNGAYGSFMNDKGIPGVVKNDHRPSIRANRAGTRGFRAPEVLFKVVNQTSAIDIWSAGVILLCMLTRKFPFFNSPTDHDALIEIGIIYGKKRMQEVAKIFSKTFDTNVPSVTEDGMTFEELIHFNNPGEYNIIPYQAIDLLKRLLMLNPAERISAEHALQHPFL